MRFRDAHRQDAPSLADIVVGVTAKAALSSLGEGETASSFGKTKAYVQQVVEIDACAQAAKAIGVFAEASCYKGCVDTMNPWARKALLFSSSWSQMPLGRRGSVTAAGSTVCVAHFSKSPETKTPTICFGFHHGLSRQPRVSL